MKTSLRAELTRSTLEAGYKRFGPFGRFGLRLKQTVKGMPRRDEHGHPTIVPERRIVIRQLFPGAWPQAISLLGIAIMEKRTLEYVSPETPHRLLAKRQLANIKAGLDTGPERQSFTPEFWQRMEDFLLMTITPACSHQAIRQQAIGENGWWRRVGRQRKAGKEARRKIAALERDMALAGARRRYQRNDLKHTMPNAGGMVPPDWPLSQDGRAPKSLSRSVYPFNTPYVSAFRKRINPRRAHNQIAFVDAQDIQEGSGVVYSENVRDEGETARMFNTPITVGSPKDTETWIDKDFKKNGDLKKPRLIRHKAARKTIVEICERKAKPKRDPVMDRTVGKTSKDYFEENKDD